MRKYKSQDRSQFTRIENHLLNTFFSGLYISASDILHVAKSVGLDLAMNNRELLIKDLLNKSYEQHCLEDVTQLLTKLIESRVAQYEALAQNYKASATILKALALRAQSSKKLLLTEAQGVNL